MLKTAIAASTNAIKPVFIMSATHRILPTQRQTAHDMDSSYFGMFLRIGRKKMVHSLSALMEGGLDSICWH